MLIRRPPDILSRDITDESLYLNRREWLAAAGITLVALQPSRLLAALPRLTAVQDLKPNTYQEITTYNNYYEFGTSKDQPAKNAGTLRPKPWNVVVEGDVKKPATYALEDLLKGIPVVDKVYRHRCVEAWSMVIPWQGIQLKDLIKKLEPGTKAKYIQFTTLLDPVQMPLARESGFSGPYIEGLRLDEAMHPLALLATGIYGKSLLNQNGAPLRLVTPWKYGFKGGKSIVKISFVEKQPLNTWQQLASDEYGFFANVNPTVDHPRWSQAKERRIGEFTKSHDTLMFNGYSEVASLYSGMDLRKYY